MRTKGHDHPGCCNQHIYLKPSRYWWIGHRHRRWLRNDQVEVTKVRRWREAYVMGARMARRTGTRGLRARCWAWTVAWLAVGLEPPRTLKLRRVG